MTACHHRTVACHIEETCGHQQVHDANLRRQDPSLDDTILVLHPVELYAYVNQLGKIRTVLNHQRVSSVIKAWYWLTLSTMTTPIELAHDSCFHVFGTSIWVVWGTPIGWKRRIFLPWSSSRVLQTWRKSSHISMLRFYILTWDCICIQHAFILILSHVIIYIYI